MQMTQLLLQEMEAEALITRKMLLLVPNDNYDWKPHEKSMRILQLGDGEREIPVFTELVIIVSMLI